MARRGEIWSDIPGNYTVSLRQMGRGSSECGLGRYVGIVRSLGASIAVLATCLLGYRGLEAREDQRVGPAQRTTKIFGVFSRFHQGHCGINNRVPPSPSWRSIKKTRDEEDLQTAGLLDDDLTLQIHLKLISEQMAPRSQGHRMISRNCRGNASNRLTLSDDDAQPFYQLNLIRPVLTNELDLRGPLSK